MTDIEFQHELGALAPALVRFFKARACRSEVEDLFQETALRAWCAREAFSGGNFAAWVFRIAKNIFLDHLRMRRRSKVVSETDAAVRLV